MSSIDQALVNPQQALSQLSRVGSHFRGLGTATIGGVAVRRIQLQIPGGSLHAFGDFPQQVRHWTEEIDVSRADLVLRRLTVDGLGTVGLPGGQVPFTYHVQLTLRDFGARVNIQPPA